MIIDLSNICLSQLAALSLARSRSHSTMWRSNLPYTEITTTKFSTLVSAYEVDAAHASRTRVMCLPNEIMYIGH